jgi:phosphohistidine phosphatase SixA
MIRWFAAGVLAAVLLAPFDPARADDGFWRAIGSGGHAVLIRHALAPGTGDPPGFDVDDCATQRNLDDRGRDQARAIGDLFRANGIDAARVFSSQWCRCLETARLMNLGAVQDLRILNSFYQRFDRGPMQTAALEEFLAAEPLLEPTVLVTHQVNITALTDVFPSSGELVVVKRRDDGGIVVVGTLETM